MQARVDPDLNLYIGGTAIEQINGVNLRSPSETHVDRIRL